MSSSARLSDPLPVQRVGQRVMAGEGAGVVELLMQMPELRLCHRHFFLQIFQLLARLRSLLGHRVGSLNDIIKQRPEIFQPGHVLDLASTFFNVHFKLAAGTIHHPQPFDELGEHMAHFRLRLDGPRLRPPLLFHDVAQSAFHFIEVTQGQRRRHTGQQAIDLPLEPTVVSAQLANVLDDQVQQLEQQLLDFKLLFRCEHGLMDQAAKKGLGRLNLNRRLPEQPNQLAGHPDHPRIRFTKRRQYSLDETCQFTGKLNRQNHQKIMSHFRVGTRLTSLGKSTQGLLDPLPATP